MARLKPCKALASESSPSRLTSTLAPSSLAEVRPGSSKSSLPLGPSTNTFWPLISTFTLGGTATGNFPIRDINSPNFAKQFTAHVLLARLQAGHDALRGGQDGNAQTAAHPRHFQRARVT